MKSVRVFSGPYFTVFGLNTGKYGPEKPPYLDTLHAVCKERLFHSLVRIWSENSKTIPNEVKKGGLHDSDMCRFGAI